MDVVNSLVSANETVNATNFSGHPQVLVEMCFSSIKAASSHVQFFDALYQLRSLVAVHPNVLYELTREWLSVFSRYNFFLCKYLNFKRFLTVTPSCNDDDLALSEILRLIAFTCAHFVLETKDISAIAGYLKTNLLRLLESSLGEEYRNF